MLSWHECRNPKRTVKTILLELSAPREWSFSYNKHMRTRRSGLKYIKHKENPTSFKKGIAPWNKGMKGYHAGGEHYRFGKKVSEETRKKISATKQGISREDWNDFKRTMNYLERRRFQHSIQNQVFERDDYTCQLCKTRGGILHVDHIQSFAEYVEGRFMIDNCRTLCRSCHYKVTFGKPMPQDSKWGKSSMPSNESLTFKEKAG